MRKIVNKWESSKKLEALSKVDIKLCSIFSSNGHGRQDESYLRWSCIPHCKCICLLLKVWTSFRYCIRWLIEDLAKSWRCEIGVFRVLQLLVRFVCVCAALLADFHGNMYNSMMTPSKGNIFRVTGLLCVEFTGDRWIPHTKASDAELWCFLRPALQQTVEQTIDTPVIWDAIALIMTLL